MQSQLNKLNQLSIAREAGRQGAFPSLGHWSRREKLLQAWLLWSVLPLSNVSLRSSASPDEEMYATFPPQSCCGKALFKRATLGRGTVVEGSSLNFGPLLPRPISVSLGVMTLGFAVLFRHR